MGSDFANCRLCGVLLVRENHIKYGKTREYGEVGQFFANTTAEYGWLHAPCPNCGEPEPIRPRLVDRLMGLLYMLLGFAILFGIIFLMVVILG